MKIRLYQNLSEKYGSPYIYPDGKGGYEEFYPPENYSFLPAGNIYLTLNTIRISNKLDLNVYDVHRSNKYYNKYKQFTTPIGILADNSVIKQVKELEKKTSAKRELARDKKYAKKIATQDDNDIPDEYFR